MTGDTRLASAARVASGAARGMASDEASGGRVVLDGVTVTYPGRRDPALDVSLAVAAGELVAVAGRTGAGKSTLALTAGGFVPRVVRARVSGSVRIDGVDPVAAGGADMAGRVGIVFSTPANQLSASKSTVREELAFGLENLAVPRSEMDARIDEVLDRLSITNLADRDPLALSGGEQQRVAIASILVMGTSVLVLDEPVAQLDPAGAQGVASLLRQLAASGRTVVCAEQNPVVLSAARRCLVLEDGCAIALDVPGVALGSVVQAPLGLKPPTLVALAELAGVAPELAFDEAAVAAGLATAHGHSDLRACAASTGVDAAQRVDWSPLRSEETPSLSVRGVVHRYPGGPEVLRGINVTVGPGEAVAIVGQNGSGKTTLVKHLNGLLRPDAGSVEVDGRDIRTEAVGSIARTVGFVFQDPDSQLFSRSVDREVAFGGRNIGLEGRLARALVDRALDLTGLTGLREVNPYDLGLSIRKLVALASVLATEPAVLVLDEPTTGQDGPGAARIGSIVEAYRRAGRTVIAVTHDMEFAAEHFGRVIVMREGEIVADGSPADVLETARTDLLETTGLFPPVAARLGSKLGLGATPTLASLVSALAARRN
jgi:energy-coupling factor transport system ATP-binding protein